MKIEAGKFYKTRDGRKARIYATDGGPGNQVHGSILTRTSGGGVWTVHCWNAQGERLAGDSMDYDLVAEWTEPKPRLKAWIRDGVVHFGVGIRTGATPDDFDGWTRADWLDQPEDGK